ncbi:PQQ-dependent sugar dehydrogenase [Candidatus Daviesbacteria bacterium]|nr:PQQ-dependent sugar dehydrogenase [Candidatus Daviesbacteria bacterium]
MNKQSFSSNKNIFIGLALAVFIGILIRGASKGVDRAQFTQERQEDIEIIAENLNIPWEAAFLPDNEILITERPGTLLLLKNKQKIPISGVEHIGEGGLLGLAIHPNFSSNHWIYLYYTYQINGETYNKIVRFEYSVVELAVACLDNKPDCNSAATPRLALSKIIVDKIPATPNHNGGRIKFGPDGYLYITTGDAQNPSQAQNINSFAGKVLRVTDGGNPAPGNPFSSLIYSYGHRNSQGLAWDDKGRLWATEHGRSGVQSGFDELNLIEKGKNYGWPVIQGDQTKEDMVNPVIQSGEDITWAPAGAVFYEGSIFFGGLRGEALFEYKIADKGLKRHFQGQFGRIRAVVLGPDNYLYITTSNTDGRGNPKENDDKLIKINPKVLK